jgi:hypothetical protein
MYIVSQNVFRKELINRVKLQINRNSVKDKLRDLVVWMDVVKKDANHQVIKLSKIGFTLRYVHVLLITFRRN